MTTSMLETVHAQFTLSEDTLVNITKTFLHEAAEGLASYGKPMAMIPTFVELIPDGSETGTFLAVDLGGTNLRVCKVTFHGNKTFSPDQETYEVPNELKTGSATALFDHIAHSVRKFIAKSKSQFSTMPPSPAPFVSYNAILDNSDSSYALVAFTFSFPVDQKALDSGTLLSWTKGYAVKDAVNKDVVKLLQDAFDRNKIHVKCVALLNDTVGTLLTRAYVAGGCVLGAIVGTGTNGAYVEKVANITKLEDRADAGEGTHMVVNTEWGAFDNARTALPTTLYDDTLDHESLNPGQQAFEKFISGMYLGEITRIIILSFVGASPKPLLFEGRRTSVLDEKGGLNTAVLSAVEEAWLGKSTSDQAGDTSEEPEEEKLKRVREVIAKKFDFPDPSVVLLSDANVVRQICGLVATRAARLTACAMAAILVQTGRARLTRSDDSGSVPLQDEGKTINIGVDGSMIQYYPRFRDMIRETLRTLVGPEVESRVDIEMAKDGSGVGGELILGHVRGHNVSNAGSFTPALCALIARNQYLARFRK